MGEVILMWGGETAKVLERMKGGRLLVSPAAGIHKGEQVVVRPLVKWVVETWVE